jgi:hypothetical protein
MEETHAAAAWRRHMRRQHGGDTCGGSASAGRNAILHNRRRSSPGDPSLLNFYLRRCSLFDFNSDVPPASHVCHVISEVVLKYSLFATARKQVASSNGP